MVIPFHFIAYSSNFTISIYSDFKTLFGPEIGITQKVPFAIMKKILSFVRFPFREGVNGIQYRLE